MKSEKWNTISSSIIRVLRVLSRYIFAMAGSATCEILLGTFFVQVVSAQQPEDFIVNEKR